MATDQFAAGIATAEMRAAQRPPEPARLRWWFEDSAGELVFVQAPNLSAGAASALYVAGRVPPTPASARKLLTALGHLALLMWAGDEVLRGTTPARRVTGALTAAALVTRRAHQVRKSRP